MLVALGAWLAVGTVAAATASADSAGAESETPAARDARQRGALASERGYKLRVAAAMTLGRNLTDENVAALVAALRTDQEAMVRRVAVIAVVKACALPTLSPRARAAACEALAAARRDADAKVKKLALAASAAGTTAPAQATPHGLYVYLPVTKRTAEHMALVSAIGAGLAEASTTFAVDWASQSPAQADLARKARRAYRVDVAVAHIDVRKTPGGGMSLQCSVSMAVAPWYGADQAERWSAADTARITGSARVESRGPRAQAVAECVRALGRDIAQKRLAVFLRTTSRQDGGKHDVAKR